METQSKFKIDDKYIEIIKKAPTFERTIDGPGWKLGLPFEDQHELDESLACLFRWRDYTCFTFLPFKSCEDEQRMFEYVPVETYVFIRERCLDHPQDKHIVSIRFNVGMRYLDEKPS